MPILKLAFYLYAAGTIGIVDFYGFGDLDLAKLRAALTFHEGNSVPSDKRNTAAEEALRKLTGRDVSISGVCCLENGRSTVYVGSAEPGERARPGTAGQTRCGFLQEMIEGGKTEETVRAAQ